MMMVDRIMIVITVTWMSLTWMIYNVMKLLGLIWTFRLGIKHGRGGGLSLRRIKSLSKG
jgi:hypothetical protein